MSSPTDLESRIADAISFGKEDSIALYELADIVRASPARAKEALHRLRRLGYPIRLSRAGIIEHSNFRLIDSQQLTRDLFTEKIGRRTECRLHVRSTQDELKKLGGEAQDGTVLIAETQYAGRGRLTRSWFSGLGGIWMSVLLRPTWRRDHQILTLAFATAISRAVDEVTGVSCLLKWPNDLMVRSHKIAGILAEGTYQGSRLDNLIVGLGVNANIEMRRFPKHLRKASTSIMHELGREVDRFMLTKKIIEEMDKSYRRFESGHLDELLDEIKRLCSTIGRNVRVTTSERSLTGYAVDVGDDGQLLVRLKSGVTVQFYAADIVHLR